MMRRLHRWLGYGSALFMLLVVWSGVLALLAPEITWWLTPQASAAHSATTAGLNSMGALLTTQARQGATENGAIWFLRFPVGPDPTFRLWHFDGWQFQGPALDGATGSPLPPSSTADLPALNGSLFSTFHETLLLGWAGKVVVCLAGISLLTCLLTGLWMERSRLGKEVKRFFKRLRAIATQRPWPLTRGGWFDLHTGGGAFQAATVFILAFGGTWLAVLALAPLFPRQPPPPATHVVARQVGEAQPLSAIVVQSKALWGKHGAGFAMLVPMEGAPGGELRLYHADQAAFCPDRAYIDDHLRLHAGHSCSQPSLLVRAIHELRWAGPWLRALATLAGLGVYGAVLSGLMLHASRSKATATAWGRVLLALAWGLPPFTLVALGLWGVALRL
ncbi:PepSY domain-containing protein [Formicincola oecophyllae]|uniref:PepSY domain-containing protein n=1 Tax=Formicincola oecophyllae TaxID=2558361 RepID=A0A4Y6U7L6_9PROT|nr:PepSY-associated TM helix domain-containing protein [Formicincola oecophyllae]QDH13399.1 PepSY domain-containing protein [Formicincola oecophyllae]